MYAQNTATPSGKLLMLPPKLPLLGNLLCVYEWIGHARQCVSVLSTDCVGVM